jgi:hypothetical protein
MEVRSAGSLPGDVLGELDRIFSLQISQRDPELAITRLWTWSRTTAWRRVKEVMAASDYFFVALSLSGGDTDPSCPAIQFVRRDVIPRRSQLVPYVPGHKIRSLPLIKRGNFAIKKPS